MAWTRRAYDTFTDGYSVNLESHTPDEGAAWVRSGNWNVYDTYVSEGTGEADGDYARNTTSLLGKQACEGQLNSGADRVGLVLRWQSGSASGYAVEWRANYPLLTLWRVDSGIRTQLDQTADGGTSTSTVRMEADGSTITVLIDGAVKITKSDATYGAGYSGLYRAAGGGISVNTFAAYDDAGGGGLSVPVAMHQARMQGMA